MGLLIIRKYISDLLRYKYSIIFFFAVYRWKRVVEGTEGEQIRSRKKSHRKCVHQRSLATAAATPGRATHAAQASTHHLQLFYLITFKYKDNLYERSQPEENLMRFIISCKSEDATTNLWAIWLCKSCK